MAKPTQQELEAQAARSTPSLDELPDANGAPGDIPATPAQPAAAAPPTAAAPQDKLADPAFNRFLAERADRHAELAAAQNKADESHRWAEIGNRFRRTADHFAGREYDEKAGQSRLDAAERPVQQLLQQRGAEAQATKDLGAELGVKKEAVGVQGLQDSLDPNSDMSKRGRMLAVAQGLIPPSYTGEYTESMRQDMLKGATIQEAREHHQGQLAQAQAGLVASERHRKSEEKMHGEKLDLGWAQLDEAARQHDLQFEAKTSKEKEIPPRQLERYAGIKSVTDALGSYQKQLQGAESASDTGPVMGRIASINPLRGPAATTAIATEEALKVKLARALHGGAPGRTEIEQAGKYIPSVKDTPQQRNAKISALTSLLNDEVSTLKKTYGEGGLNTKRLTGAEPAAAPAAAAAPQRVPLKRVPSTDGKFWRVDYSDGTSEVVPNG